MKDVGVGRLELPTSALSRRRSEPTELNTQEIAAAAGFCCRAPKVSIDRELVRRAAPKMS